jgi:peptidoglycan/LPS O-acetylase OafA/YrhL
MTCPVPERMPGLPALTGIRFIAASAVLVFHYGATFTEKAGAPKSLVQLLHNGYLGVSLFFVLSGFILTYSHYCDPIDSKFAKNFFIARFARIYPVYALALLFAIPTLMSSPSFGETIAVLTMVQSWTPPNSDAGYAWITQAWTLSVELFFYLCFPGLLFLARRASTIQTVTLIVICALIIVTFGTPSIYPDSPPIPVVSKDVILPIPVFRAAEFAYGVLLCKLVMQSPSIAVRLNRTSWQLATFTLIIVLLSSSNNTHVKGMCTVLLGLLVVELSGPNGMIANLLSSRLMAFLGGASFALYIFQGPVRAYCDHAIPHPIDRFVSPPLTLFLAAIVFTFWEQPWRKRILRVSRRWMPPHPTSGSQRSIIYR